MSKQDYWDEFQDIKQGKLIRLEDGYYKFEKSVNAAQLTKGMKLGATWSGSQYGFDYVELEGVYALHKSKEHDEEYLKHEILHRSVKDALARLDMQGALAKVDDNDWALRLYVKDLESKDEGDWYYLYKGRFCRGSGADKLSFFEIKKV